MWFILRLNSPILIGKKGYVEVNLCVPLSKSGKADLIRLNELERKAKEMFKDGVVGQYDGSWYRYSSESIGIEEDQRIMLLLCECKIII